MKILFYNHTGKVSGAEKMLLLILAKLDRNSFEPIALCPEQDSQKSLATMIRDLGVEMRVCPSLESRFTLRVDLLLKYLWSFVQVIRVVRAAVVKSQPDLVHANSIRAGLVATAATLGLGTKVAWHLHDLLPRHPLSSAIRIFALASARTKMIAVSQAVADNFVGQLFSLRNRVSVILNGIEIENFKAVAGLREQTRKRLELADSDFVVGIVGLLTPRKGQLELIRSFAGVLEQVSKAKLLIVGSAVFDKDEKYEALLKKTATELGVSERVIFTGARDDVPAIMQSLDLLVANSSVEPFGLVIVEAMAAGAPVLAAISGGIPEIIQCGRSGWLLEHGDERMLTEAIVKLAQTPRVRMKLAEEGTRRAEAFGSSRYLNELQNFYRSNNEPGAVVASQDATVSRRRLAKTA